MTQSTDMPLDTSGNTGGFDIIQYTTEIYDGLGRQIYDRNKPDSKLWTLFQAWKQLAEPIKKPSLIIQIQGVDGQVYDLSGPMIGRQGVRLMPKLVGLDHPDYQSRYVDGPYTRGSLFSGIKWEKRTLNMVLGFMVDSHISPTEVSELGVKQNKANVRRDRFFRSLSETEPFWVRVFYDHGWLYLKVRLERSTPKPIEYNPTTQVLLTDEITLVSEDPFFSGRPIIEEWTNTEDRSYFFGEGRHEFRLVNRGDVDCYWQFIVYGGGNVTIENYNHDYTIKMPFALPAEGPYLVNTDPNKKPIISLGTPVDNLLFKAMRGSSILSNLPFFGDIAELGEPMYKRINPPWFDGKHLANTVQTIKVTHSIPDGKVIAIVPQQRKRYF